jgi:hypothetical protein
MGMSEVACVPAFHTNQGNGNSWPNFPVADHNSLGGLRGI